MATQNNIQLVFVTFLVAKTKDPISKVKGGKVYFCSQFVEVSVRSQLAQR